jgi:hypothetical protein
MRSTFLAVAVALSVGAATPALAAPKHLNLKNPTPSYDTCEALAVERGVPPGEGNASNPDAQHNASSAHVLRVRYRPQGPSAKLSSFDLSGGRGDINVRNGF